MPLRVIAPILLLSAAVPLGSCGDAPPLYEGHAQNACRTEIFERDAFTICSARPDRHTIALALTGGDDRPLRSHHDLAEFLGAERGRIAFAFNAGMFDDEGEPIGLYVAGGVERQPLNSAEGPGNFHLMPNGVFYGDASGWHVATTQDFAQDRPESLTFATQSGPMLVIDGEVHPDFSADGTSQYRRNGVCVDAEGAAHFAISEARVSFGRFARLFRDALGCRDALFLDGAVSQLWNPPASRMDAEAPIGPIVVVRERR